MVQAQRDTAGPYSDNILIGARARFTLKLHRVVIKRPASTKYTPGLPYTAYTLHLSARTSFNFTDRERVLI